MKTLKKIQIALLAISFVMLGALPVNAQLHRPSNDEIRPTHVSGPQASNTISQSALVTTNTKGVEVMALSDYGPLYLNAGVDVTICNSESYLLKGVNGTSEKAMWISDGDGVFNNPYSLHPVYTAGESDKMYGTVKVYLCIITPVSIYPIKASDFMVLTLQNWCGSDADENEF